MQRCQYGHPVVPLAHSEQGICRDIYLNKDREADGRLVQHASHSHSFGQDFEDSLNSLIVPPC